MALESRFALKQRLIGIAFIALLLMLLAVYSTQRPEPDLRLITDRNEAPKLEWDEAPDALNPVLSARTPKKLQDYAGKVVYFNFWAEWCEPCKKEVPKIVELYKDFDWVPLTVVMFNLDSNSADFFRVHEYARRTMPELAHVSHSAELAEAMSVNGLPYHILFDRSGRVAFRHRGDLSSRWDEFKALVLQLVAEPAANR